MLTLLVDDAVVIYHLKSLLYIIYIYSNSPNTRAQKHELLDLIYRKKSLQLTIYYSSDSQVLQTLKLLKPVFRFKNYFFND